MFLKLFLFSIFHVGILRGKFVTVRVKEGLLEGQLLETTTGKNSYYSFRGVPFATPPLGELRFKAPQSPSCWEGVRKATEYAAACPQQPPGSTVVIGNEDCLYLNVFTPNLVPAEPLPVMFFIHGGGFAFYTSDNYNYGPDFLMSNSVVLVTTNYRLNALGFLAVDTVEVPGNAGLKDQVAAMKWVQQNIRKFGGDPSNVTIFGQSAGAVSVSLHIISQTTKGLFNRAICMSGVMFNDFVGGFAHRERAFNLGRLLGFYTSDPDELVRFLRRVPAEKLVELQPYVQLSDKIGHIMNETPFFIPIVEKQLGGDHFLTEQPLDIKQRGMEQDLDLMIGHTDCEGIFNVLPVQNEILEYFPQYKQLFVPQLIKNKISMSRILKLGSQIENYYFGNDTVTLSSMRSFINFSSYKSYIYHIHTFLDDFVTKNNKTNRFLYEFSIVGDRNLQSAQAKSRFGFQCASHRDDLPYLFDGTGYIKVDLNSKSYEYVQLMCTLFTNFAKTGNPTPDNSLNFIWPKYDDNMKYVRLGNEISVRKVEYTGDLGFWRDIYQQSGVKPYISE